METESVLKRIKSFKYIIVLEGVAVGFLAGIAVTIVFQALYREGRGPEKRIH